MHMVQELFKNAANEIKRTFLTVGRLINVLEGKDELYEIGRNLQEMI